MNKDLYAVNNRFVVYKNSNEVYDKELGQKKRVEPRLIKLLCLLIDSEGKVLTRQYIIKEIWDDYPGANEGLNQAISFLRKLLADENRQIIQTIPKKGYIFNAVISLKSAQEPFQRRHSRRTMTIAASILLAFLLISGWYSFNANKRGAGISYGNLSKEKTVELSKSALTLFLKAKQAPVIDDGSLKEKNLRELARLDIIGGSDKMHHLQAKKPSLINNENPNEKNPEELARLDMISGLDNKHH
jgi:DNA-binding winged helix-turn-helix (wHTH) protein